MAIIGRRGSSRAVKGRQGPSRAAGGRQGPSGAVKGPSGAIRGHTGAVGAIRVRRPQVYFSPAFIVFLNTVPIYVHVKIFYFSDLENFKLKKKHQVSA